MSRGGIRMQERGRASSQGHLLIYSVSFQENEMARFDLGYFLVALVIFAEVLSMPAAAQNAAGPQPVALPPAIPAPVEQAYPGTISLSVDMTNVNQRILTVHETIPVKAGNTILLYPQWLPGTHSPSNPVGNISGLVITANGKSLEWERDRVNVWAFHLDVPKGANTL